MRCHVYILREDEARFYEILGDNGPDETVILGINQSDYLFKDLSDDAIIALKLALNTIIIQELSEVDYYNICHPWN